MTAPTKDENEDAFDKIDALKAAERAEIEVAKDDHEEVVLADGPEPNKDEVDAGIEDLRKQLEAEKNARQEAEKRAFEAANREKQAVNEAVDSNTKLFDTAIANAKRDKDTLRSQFREAMTVGDFDKVAEIQEAMTRNAVDLDKLETGKQNYIHRPKQAEATANDPVERFVANMSPKSADWIRSHPEYVTNGAKHRQMIDAHTAAVGASGLQPDSPAYFRFVEDYLGMGGETERTQQRTEARTEASPLSDAAAPVRRQVPPAAAPTSRDAALGVTNPHRVRLTAEQREVAEVTGQTYEEYAKNLVALQKEGRIGRYN